MDRTKLTSQARRLFSIAVSLTLICAAQTSWALAPQVGPRPNLPPVFELDPGGVVFPDPRPVPPPPPPPLPPALAKPGISIGARTGASLEIVWCDNSAEDQTHHLYRKKGGGAYELVGDIDSDGIGCGRRAVDGDLEPDTAYCYQIFPVRSFAEWGDFASAETCAFTRESSPRQIWRAQIELRTASGKNDGTNDSINVALNSRAPFFNQKFPVVRPFGNDTWTDRHGGFRDAGDTDRFDLDLGSIDEMGDITKIALRKEGGDKYCLDGLSLLINGVEVFTRDFSPCRLADESGLNQTTFVSIPHEELRASAAWRNYQPALIEDETAAIGTLAAGDVLDILRISKRELEERVEGIVGDAIHYEPLKWGKRDGPRFVEATRIDSNTVHVTLDLEAIADNAPNPEIDIEFDLIFNMSCDQDRQGIQFDIETANFDVRASASLVTKFLALLFTQESHLERFIEKSVRNGFSPIAQQIVFDTDGACVACQFGDPVALVEADSDVQLSIVPFSAGPPSADPFCQCPGVVEAFGISCEGDDGGEGTNPEPTPEPADGIRTTRLRLDDDDKGAFNPNRRRMVFESKDTAAAPSGIIEPGFGTAGDPTKNGASGGGARLVVYRVGGQPTDVAVTILPAGSWRRLGNATNPGFLYRDSDGVDGPIQKVRVRNRNLLIRGQGAELYSLANAPQGEMAIRLEIGSNTQWCATALAKSGARRDSTALFVGKPSAAPGACPPVPGTSGNGSASLAFLNQSASLLD